MLVHQDARCKDKTKNRNCQAIRRKNDQRATGREITSFFDNDTLIYDIRLVIQNIFRNFANTTISHIS